MEQSAEKGTSNNNQRNRNRNKFRNNRRKPRPDGKPQDAQDQDFELDNDALETSESTPQAEAAEKVNNPRPERQNIQQKQPRSDRQERHDRPERADRTERPERQQRSERADRPERSERPQRDRHEQRTEQKQDVRQEQRADARPSFKADYSQDRDDTKQLFQDDNYADLWSDTAKKNPALTTIEKRDPVVLGVSIGDFNGIGPETLLQLTTDKRLFELVTLVVYANDQLIKRWLKQLDLSKDNIWFVSEPGNFKAGKLNVVNAWDEDHELTLGQATEIAGQCAFKSLEAVVAAVNSGQVQGIVTCPISKANMPAIFTWPGHTEYFSQKFGGEEGLMVLMTDSIRIGLATVHVPIVEVPRLISTALLEDRIKVFLKALKKDFGIVKPKLAILGLNPHAGEAGRIGKEEQEIIIPLVNKLLQDGHLVFGPYPADGFFGAGQHLKFDGVLAMYHDQGLAPFKAVAFDQGVNYTAGLSVVRTSPDHGTAYRIAGKGLADPSSLRHAIYQAADIVRTRKYLAEYKR